MKYILYSICIITPLLGRTPAVITNPRMDSFICRSTATHTMTMQQEPYLIATENNGDESSIALYGGSFHKGLIHDLSNGLLTLSGIESYKQLLTALNSGNQKDFNLIALGGTRKFLNPQGAFAHSLIGLPSALISMPSAPTLTSAHAAADMIETYLNAICRDVHFDEYGTGINSDSDTFNGGSITANAAAVLTALGEAYQGPRTENGDVTPAVLFRGISEGTLIGPYISQFWYLPLHKDFTLLPINQFVPTAQTREFDISWDHFVSLQNGNIPAAYNPSDFIGTRYIITGRDITPIIHNDAQGQHFLDVANILIYNQFPLSSTLPYLNGSITKEDSFVTMGIPDVNSAIMIASEEALKHAWAHKWLASRRLRPESMAGLIHQSKINDDNNFNLDQSLFEEHANIDVLAWIKHHNETTPDGNSTYLLPQVYPEGSPMHPSYPAAHAVVAGACATIIKAFFNNDTLISSKIAPVKPNPTDPTLLVELSVEEGKDMLTVAGEVNKLASNIAIGRNIAGVHYRSDGDQGILLGEQVALTLLQNWALTYSEQGFAGFELSLMNGAKVRITGNTIENL